MKLEHANLSVENTDAMERFLVAAFPDFRRRGEGTDGQGRPWRHVGNDEFYVALQTVPTNTHRTPYGNDTGLNHLGWEVDDLEALVERMRQAGNFMLVLSGNAVKGVHGSWPGLANHQLFDGADLEVTTDYRRVLSEILIRRMGNNRIGEIFPDYTGYSPLGVVFDAVPEGSATRVRSRWCVMLSGRWSTRRARERGRRSRAPKLPARPARCR